MADTLGYIPPLPAEDADALGYIPPLAAEDADALDRIIATLYKLAR